jgi:hypothetical protein
LEPTKEEIVDEIAVIDRLLGESNPLPERRRFLQDVRSMLVSILK